VVETLAAEGDDGPFLLSTVDTVANSQTYAQFMGEVRQLEQAVVALALTSPGNDEKPLLVRCTPGDPRVVAIGEAAAPSDYATAGIYAVRASILSEAEAARSDGVNALRIFLGRLLERGYYLAGIPIARSIDVDNPDDIPTAENFLRGVEV
jgi:NDP-sugar pyrophosphorylase family protein